MIHLFSISEPRSFTFMYFLSLRSIVCFIHLASSCWSLAYSLSQAQSIFISINGFKTSHSHICTYIHTHTCLRHGRKAKISCMKILHRVEYRLFISVGITWRDVQEWEAVLLLRREHQPTYIMVVIWHSSLPLAIRLIPREAGQALNITRLDFYPQKGRRCIRLMP